MTTGHPCPPGPFTWWFSRDEEGPFTDTEIPVGAPGGREAAIQQAVDEELIVDIGQDAECLPWKVGFHLAAARRQNLNLSLWFDVDDWLDRVGDHMEECDLGGGEDGAHHPLDDLTTDDKAGLQASIRAAIWQWQARKELPLSPYCLDMAESAEWIVREIDHEP